MESKSVLTGWGSSAVSPPCTSSWFSEHAFLLLLLKTARHARVRPGALRAASFTGPKQDRRTSFLLQEAHPEGTGPTPDPVRAVEKAPSSWLKTVIQRDAYLAQQSRLVRRALRPGALPRPAP